MTYKVLKQHKSFGGQVLFCEHESNSTKTSMKFSVYLPKEVSEIKNAIIWLSGLTCTEENFITKAYANSFLKDSDTMIICPDTSPRGLNIPGEDDSYDFGSGAGFYVNATTEAYKNNYQMYDYIVRDLVGLLKDDFNVSKMAISGHSMGGHGALMIGLKNPELFTSISAFSPIVNPMACPWGQKALGGYLGDDQQGWAQYDSCELIKGGAKHANRILVDQGTSDEFLAEQLLSDNLVNVCKESEQELELNFREDYDHSYYFISSFIEDHIKFHLSNF